MFYVWPPHVWWHVFAVERYVEGGETAEEALWALRVVQWATGGVGVAAIKGVLEHPELELVGCWVHSADKAGKDVGELIGIGPSASSRPTTSTRSWRSTPTR